MLLAQGRALGSVTHPVLSTSPDTPSATPLPGPAPGPAQVSVSGWSQHKAGAGQLPREGALCKTLGAFTRPLVLGVKIAFIAPISIFKRNWWAPGKESGMLSHIWELCFTQPPSNSPWLEGMSDTEPVSKTPTSPGRGGDSAPAAFPCTQQAPGLQPRQSQDYPKLHRKSCWVSACIPPPDGAVILTVHSGSCSQGGSHPAKPRMGLWERQHHKIQQNSSLFCWEHRVTTEMAFTVLN